MGVKGIGYKTFSFEQPWFIILLKRLANASPKTEKRAPNKRTKYRDRVSISPINDKRIIKIRGEKIIANKKPSRVLFGLMLDKNFLLPISF